MAQLSLYKFINPGGVRDKNLEQVTIDAKKFMIRKSGSKSKSENSASSLNDSTNAINSFGRKMVLGINRLGASFNSTITNIDSLNKNVKSINLNLKTSSNNSSNFYKSYFKEQKQLIKLKTDKDKRDQQTQRRDLDSKSESKSEGLGGKFLSPVKSIAKKIGGGLLSFLGDLFGLLLKTALITGVLKFVTDPKNVEKIGKFFIVIREFLKFCFRIIEFGIGNIIDGLVKIIDGGILTKIVGVFQFLVGAFVLFKGISWLRNPFSILKDLRLAFKVLQFLPKAILLAAKAAKAIAMAASNKFGWKAVLIGTGVAVGGAMAIDKMTSSGGGGGDEQPSEPAAAASPGAPAPGAPAPGAPAGGEASNAEKPKQTNQQFAIGGVAKGPDSGYNVTLHGTEAIIPLDNRYTKAGGDPLANIIGMNRPSGAAGAPGTPGAAGAPGTPGAAGINGIGGSSNILSGGMGLSKTSQSLSEGMKLPFKAVGASLLANLGNVVSSLGPIGDLLKPFVQQIATPIAQSFGVPSNIVSVITSKEKIDKQSETGASKDKKGGKDGDLRSVIGEGNINIKKTDEKSKWTPSGDNTIRGMLSDVVSGLQYMSGKVEGKGGSGGGTGTGTGTAGGAPAGATKADGTGGGKSDMQVGDSVARGLSGKTGEGTEKDESKVGRSSKGVLDFIKSKGAGQFSGKTIRLSSGILNSPGDLKSVEDQLKFLKDAGAKVQLVGVPTNNPTYSSLNEKLKTLATKYGAQWMGGFEAGADKIHPKDYATLNAKMDTEVKSATKSVDQSIDKNFGMKIGQETKFKASDGNEYIAHKTKEGFKFFRTGAASVIDQGGQLLANALGQNKDGDNKAAVDTKDGKNSFILADWQRSEGGKKPVPLTKTNPPPQKANGGWINGPQSGYPVSLDGGSTVAFEGHGKEWVGMKKSGGGKASSAFVIPYNTPATKNNPGLTPRRESEAKRGGYVMPTFARGGQTNVTNWKGDTGPGSRFDLVANDKSKSRIYARTGKTKYADGGKIADAAKSMVGQYFGQNGCAISTRKMLAKAGVAPNPLVTKKILDPGTKGSLPTGEAKANSFGSDQGSVIKSAGQVAAGDVVLWDTGGGEIGHVGVAIGGGQTVHNSSSAGYKLAKMGVTGMKFHSAVRLGGTTAATGDPASGTDPDGTSSGGTNPDGTPKTEAEKPSNWWDTIANAFSGQTAKKLLGQEGGTDAAAGATPTAPGTPGAPAAPGTKPGAKPSLTAAELSKLSPEELNKMLDPTVTGASNPAVFEAAKKARESAKLKGLTGAALEKEVLIATILEKQKSTPASTTPTTPAPKISPPAQQATPTGHQVMQQTTQLKDNKSATSSQPQVSTINNNQGGGRPSGGGGGGGVIAINQGRTGSNNTDFLIPMGSPTTNQVSSRSLHLIK